MPLVRLKPREVLYARRAVMCWVHHSDGTKPVSMPSAIFSSSPSARVRLKSRAHPSPALLLFRVPSLHHLAQGLSARALPAWVPCLFATSPARVHYREDSQVHRYVPSTGFLSLPTVFSAHRLADLFHPAATSRLILFKGFSLRTATLPHRKEHAPVPLFPCALTLRLPRARALDFEAFIWAKVRSDSLVIHRPASRSLLQVFLLQVFFFSAVSPSLPRALRSWCSTPSAYTPRRNRLVCCQTADLLEFSNLPSQSPWTSG